MRVVNAPEMKRCNGVIGLAIAATAWLAGCSKEPAPAAAASNVAGPETGEGQASFPLSLEHLSIPMTNGMTTTKRIDRSAPPPWLDGNRLTLHFRKAPVPGEGEEWASWSVINIYSENLFEITRRLGMKTVEMRVLHLEKSSLKRLPADGPEQTFIQDTGYALVTDPRIPREWFLPKPRESSNSDALNADAKARRYLATTYPESFRAFD